MAIDVGRDGKIVCDVDGHGVGRGGGTPWEPLPACQRECAVRLGAGRVGEVVVVPELREFERDLSADLYGASIRHGGTVYMDGREILVKVPYRQRRGLHRGGTGEQRANECKHGYARRHIAEAVKNANLGHHMCSFCLLRRILQNTPRRSACRPARGAFL